MSSEVGIFRNIEFRKVENLRGTAKDIAEERGITSGLVLLKTRFDSPPEFEIERVSGKPIDAIRKLAEEEDIDLNQALKAAYE